MKSFNLFCFFICFVKFSFCLDNFLYSGDLKLFEGINITQSENFFLYNNIQDSNTTHISKETPNFKNQKREDEEDIRDPENIPNTKGFISKLTKSIKKFTKESFFTLGDRNKKIQQSQRDKNSVVLYKDKNITVGTLKNKFFYFLHQINYFKEIKKENNCLFFILNEKFNKSSDKAIVIPLLENKNLKYNIFVSFHNDYVVLETGQRLTIPNSKLIVSISDNITTNEEYFLSDEQFKKLSGLNDLNRFFVERFFKFNHEQKKQCIQDFKNGLIEFSENSLQNKQKDNKNTKKENKQNLTIKTDDIDLTCYEELD